MGSFEQDRIWSGFWLKKYLGCYKSSQEAIMVARQEMIVTGLDLSSYSGAGEKLVNLIHSMGWLLVYYLSESICLLNNSYKPKWDIFMKTWVHQINKLIFGCPLKKSPKQHVAGFLFALAQGGHSYSYLKYCALSVLKIQMKNGQSKIVMEVMLLCSLE